jgi:hypothetical protein
MRLLTAVRICTDFAPAIRARAHDRTRSSIGNNWGIKARRLVVEMDGTCMDRCSYMQTVHFPCDHLPIVVLASQPPQHHDQAIDQNPPHEWMSLGDGGSRHVGLRGRNWRDLDR